MKPRRATYRTLLLARVVADLPSEKIDRYLVRDAQRLIEAIETLVRIHAAQKDDIYDGVASPQPDFPNWGSVFGIFLRKPESIQRAASRKRV